MIPPAPPFFLYGSKEPGASDPGFRFGLHLLALGNNVLDEAHDTASAALLLVRLEGARRLRSNQGVLPTALLEQRRGLAVEALKLLKRLLENLLRRLLVSGCGLVLGVSLHAVFVGRLDA